MTLSVILNIIMIAIGVIIHMIGFGCLFFNRSIHISSRGRVSICFTEKYSDLMTALWIIGSIIMIIGGTMLVNALIL